MLACPGVAVLCRAAPRPSWSHGGGRAQRLAYRRASQPRRTTVTDSAGRDVSRPTRGRPAGRSSLAAVSGGHCRQNAARHRRSEPCGLPTRGPQLSRQDRRPPDRMQCSARFRGFESKRGIVLHTRRVSPRMGRPANTPVVWRSWCRSPISTRFKKRVHIGGSSDHLSSSGRSWSGPIDSGGDSLKNGLGGR